MFTSTFTAKSSNTHTAFRTGNNAVGPYSTLGFGDNNKDIASSDDRWSSLQAWELGVPDVDGTSVAIPKYVDISEAYLEMVPSADLPGTTADNAEHRMALLASDGHWNRSRQNALHADQQPPPVNIALARKVVYSAPSFGLNLHFRAYDGVDLIANTMTQTTSPNESVVSTGPTGDTTKRNRHAMGTTIKIPAGNQVDTIKIVMSRLASVLNPLVAVRAYTLKKNDRHYAVDAEIGVSVAQNYQAIPINVAPSAEEVDWTFSPPLTTADMGNADEAQWIGFMIEGPGKADWFQAFLQFATPILLRARERSSGDQQAYMPGMEGNAFFASTHATLQYDNSFPYYYYWQIDLPCLYEALGTTPITTPYNRHFGTVMATTTDNAWVNAVPETYGSAGSSPTEVFSGIVANIQAWIDSSDYDPSVGETWIGIILEVLNPDNRIWPYYSSLDTKTNGFPGPKLVIDWAPKDPTILGEDIKDVKFVDIPATDQVAAIWTIKLRSTVSDLLKVPGLESTDAVASLTSGVTAKADLLVNGHNLIKLTPSVTISGNVMIATLHRKGAINNLSIDETPTLGV